MKHMCRIGLLLALLATVQIGCGSRSGHIHYVVPDDFRGAIIVHTGREDGVELDTRNGRTICRIPESGVLKVRGKGPFYAWHSTTVSFANGAPVPVVHGSEDIGDDVVAFWGCGSGPGGRIYDFIGSKAEFQEFRAQTATAEITPGGVRESQ